MARTSSGAVGRNSSPAALRYQSELQSECDRLREQLSLAQQQLAKAAASLSARRDPNFTLRNKRRQSEQAQGRGWGKGKKKEDEAPEPAEAVPEEQKLASDVLVSTTAQLDAERLRAATLSKELVELKSQTDGKLDERLNEMARRLNRANQSNEVRYKNMALETEDMKQQILSARKAYLRKAMDAELDTKERQKAADEKLLKAVAYAQGLREEVAQARVLATQNERLRRELTVQHDLVKRSSGAISTLREANVNMDQELERFQLRAEDAEKRAEEAESRVQELQKKVDALTGRLSEKEKESSTKSDEIAELEKKIAALNSSLDERNSQQARAGGRKDSAGISKTVRVPNSNVEQLLLHELIGSRQSRSPSLAEALGEAPPKLKRTQDSGGSLPSGSEDETWKAWITAPFLYDKWDTLRNDEPSAAFARQSGPLVKQVKGHAFELGMKYVPPIGSPNHLTFIEPLERVPYYQQFLQERDHLHLVGASTSGEHMVLTLEAANEGNRTVPLLSLVHMKLGTQRAVLNMEKAEVPGNVVQLDTFLEATYPGCSFKRVDDPAAHTLVTQRLVDFENMHLDFNRRVGVLYWKSGQNENEAFGNNMSPALDEFLNFFGERVRLKGWSKFRGGLNVKNDETGEYSVYAEYKDFCFMTHVSALLPYRENDEQKLDRKRHIGNDLVVIIFWEGPGAFDATQLVTQMCHVFIVIERVPSENEPGSKPRYRVAMVCRSGVQPFPPYLPLPGVFDADEHFREWLFMKIINGERATFQAKTFRVKTTTARKIHLDKLARDAMGMMTDPVDFNHPFSWHRMVVREPLIRVKTTSAFQAITPTQLSFKKGEEVVVFAKLSAEWWNGGTGMRRGDFPTGKVVVIEKKERRRRGAARTQAVSAKVEQTSRGTPASSPPPEALGASHEITYTIVKACNLTWKTTPDPICKTYIISVNGPLPASESRTGKAKQTLNPEWNESKSVKILDPLWEVLRVEVYDGEVAKGNLMGQAEFACGELLGSLQSTPLEANLEVGGDIRTGESTVTGTVHVCVTNVLELDNRTLMTRSLSTLGEAF